MQDYYHDYFGLLHGFIAYSRAEEWEEMHETKGDHMLLGQT